MFVDEAIIDVQAGKGGDGSASFRREKYIPNGGPDGGDGGDGGSVYLVVKENIHGLARVLATRQYRAKNGEPGRGKQRYGAKGADTVVEVPPGTVIYEVNRDGERELIDFGAAGASRYCVVRGGKGGLGNIHFKSSTNQAPRETTPGTPGEKKRLRLVVKHLADVGLVGLPNAGKSTLLSVISGAKPQIANYPFTTLEPHLGIIQSGDTRLVVADIPGLIEGAAVGKGLGHKFLQHLARTRILVHLIDVNVEDPMSAYQTIHKELLEYDPSLGSRPELIVLTKAETVDEGELIQKREELGGLHRVVLAISAATKFGVPKLLAAIVKNSVESA